MRTENRQPGRVLPPVSSHLYLAVAPQGSAQKQLVHLEVDGHGRERGRERAAVVSRSVLSTLLPCTFRDVQRNRESRSLQLLKGIQAAPRHGLANASRQRQKLDRAAVDVQLLVSKHTASSRRRRSRRRRRRRPRSRNATGTYGCPNCSGYSCVGPKARGRANARAASLLGLLVFSGRDRPGDHVQIALRKASTIRVFASRSLTATRTADSPRRRLKLEASRK